MITRPSPAIRALLSTPSHLTTQLRCLHRNMPAQRIPEPTPFVPDASTFLTLIGRNMSQHSAKIPSWDALFSLSSQQLRESGIEPARSRRYLLHWRDKFRNGEFGIGGDLTEVVDGAAELRIVEVPAEVGSSARATLTSSPGMKKIVVNVPPGQDRPRVSLEEVRAVQGVKIVRAGVLSAPHIEAVKGMPGVAKIVAKEGLWEQRRGHKVDGGERRKAEVRYKRKAEERKNARS